MVVLAFIILLVITASFAAGLCPNSCSCNDETYEVVCHKDVKLDVIPIALNPEIQRLDLKNNKIKTVDSAFQFYKDLQYVDLSSNHLVTIPEKSFLYQRKLQELHLNRNKLSSINNHTFVGLESLTVLNLRENHIESLSERLFFETPKLELLNLGQNRIEQIDAKTFYGLSSLKVLHLDHNLLVSVPSESFVNCNSLAELRIGWNQFVELRDDAFSSLDKLTLLDLRSTSLLNVSVNAFHGLNGLKSLNLIDNRLDAVPTDQINHLRRLEELYIGQNSFDMLDRKSFKGLSNLRKIDISGAPNLSHIVRGAFSDNLNLETLTIANNKKLESMEDGSLLGLPNLRHLDLRDNGFLTISESLVAWDSLKVLEFADNPFFCDCRLLWLSRLLTIKNWSSVQCEEPFMLKGRILKEISADDLGCSFQDPRQQAMLVTLGVSAVIVLGGIALLLFRYRQRVGEALKDYKWNKRAALNRKEHEYQKTYSEDEFIVRTARHHHCLKPIPVTEL